MYVNIGQIIALHREKQNPRWTQHRLAHELRNQVGFKVSRAYIAGIETGKVEASKRTLIACEQVFGLKTGTLLMYAALEHAQKFCEDTQRSLTDYVRMLDQAIKSLVPAADRSSTTAALGESRDLDSAVSKEPREILTLEQVAKLLWLHSSTIYRMVKRGEIPAVKVGRVWRFSKDALDKWLNHGVRGGRRIGGRERPARKREDPVLRSIGTLAVGTLSKDIDTGLYGGQ